MSTTNIVMVDPLKMDFDVAAKALIDIFCTVAPEPLRYRFVLPRVEKALRDLDLLEEAVEELQNSEAEKGNFSRAWES